MRLKDEHEDGDRMDATAGNGRSDVESDPRLHDSWPGLSQLLRDASGASIQRSGKPLQGLTRRTDKGVVWTAISGLSPEALDEPVHRKQPSSVFVNSMTNLFHEDVSPEFVARIFDVVERTPQHTISS